jgi:hypothetical protein
MVAKVRRGALIGLANLVVVILLFALVEGFSSLMFIGNEILRTAGVPEHIHAEHDDLLGWVNMPNVHLPDMYGPGVGVRTNSQRFRNQQDFTRTVPAGKIRIICSGDSFTFGYGVSNDDVWCERLSGLDVRLETVNMGLGGYGVDQAYLWYRRDGVRLHHNVHIFAFLTDDFRRMRSDRFMGYGKPFLSIRNDSLVVENYPVPRTSWWTRRRALHGETVGRLNVVRLANRVLRLEDRAGNTERHADETRRIQAVVSRIFADLRQTNRARGSDLVLVYFPGAWDYMGGAGTEAWREFVRNEAARQGIILFDLVAELRRVPPTEVGDLYAPNHHFSVAGNEWAARVIHQRLVGLLDDQGLPPDAVR